MAIYPRFRVPQAGPPVALQPNNVSRGPVDGTPPRNRGSAQRHGGKPLPAHHQQKFPADTCRGQSWHDFTMSNRRSRKGMGVMNRSRLSKCSTGFNPRMSDHTKAGKDGMTAYNHVIFRAGCP